MQVTIEGYDLPGLSCTPGPYGPYENIHVALRCRKDPTKWIPGDAESARWDFEINLKVGAEGGHDFGGPYVLGPRGQRCVYLQWGTVDDASTFTMFRAAKLMLDQVDPQVIDRAVRPGHRLVAWIDLTDAKGHPRCASVKPPFLVWSAQPA